MADNERPLDDRPLFQGFDELEREIAPQELAPDDPRRRRADADESAMDSRAYEDNEVPLAAPVANVGSSPSGAMAPVNTHDENEKLVADAVDNQRGDNPYGPADDEV